MSARLPVLGESMADASALPWLNAGFDDPPALAGRIGGPHERDAAPRTGRRPTVRSRTSSAPSRTWRLRPRTRARTRRAVRGVRPWVRPQRVW